MRWPCATGEGLGAAFDWNLARTMRVAKGGQAVLRPREARVLSVLLGSWLTTSIKGCQPLKGTHPHGCPHTANIVPLRIGVLAEAIFGFNGGSQRQQVKAALRLLIDTLVAYEPVDRDGRRERVTGALLAEVPWTPDLRSMFAERGLAASVDYAVRFDEPLLRSLLAGHLQRVPLPLVQGLDDSAFLIWLAGLCQDPWSFSAKGMLRWIPVTGTNPWTPRWRLGLAGSTPAELRIALQRAAEHGNELQDGYRLEVGASKPRARRTLEPVAFRVIKVKSIAGRQSGASGRQSAAARSAADGGSRPAP